MSGTANSFGPNFAFVDQDNVNDSEWMDFGAEKNAFSPNSNPFRPKSSDIGEADSRRISSKKTTPAVVENTETRVVDTVPLEDVPLESVSQDKADNFVPQTVARIMSEDTQDTNDTAPMSNRDPNRPPVHPSSPNASKNLNLDAFCSKYFNTPAGQQMHSTGALGDFISPVESPLEEEDEEEDHTSQSEQSSSRQDFMKDLEIPRMGVNLVRTESEASSLLGETLVEEKKMGDDHGGIPFLPPDKNNSNATNASKQTPKRARGRTLVRPSQSPIRRNHAVVETATVTSASTFTTSRSSSPLSSAEARPLTPHPFFWRTFPNVTVTSDDIQGDPQSSLQSGLQSSRAADMAALAAVRQAVQEHIRQHTMEIVNEDLPPGAECSPFVDQEVIKRLWMERRRQGLSSAETTTMGHRRNNLVQSVTGVFNRNQYQPPENLNLAMG